MKFKYIALNSKNKKQKGYVNATDKKKAVEVLKHSNLKIITLEVKEAGFLEGKIPGFGGRVSAKEFVIFSRQLAILIEAGVPLLKALKSIALQTNSNVLLIRLQQIVADVEGGSSVSEALEKHPDTFSRFYVNMVKAGEVSGNLQKALNDLANNIEKNYDLSRNLKSAMYYPAFILSTMFVVGYGMMAFVIPKLLVILVEADVTLPLQTRVLIVVSNFSATYWWAIIPAAIGVVVSLILYLKTAEGRAEYDKFILKVPVISKILENIYIARFSENLTSLLKSGITINVALVITADVVGNTIYKEAILFSVKEIKKGDKIGEALGQSGVFPPIVIQMIQVGEGSGKIAYTLSKVTDFYAKEADIMVKNFSALIEPFIMVILAIGVGLLVSAILLPIYQVSTAI